MTIPTATYRLQFRNGMTFAQAAALADYLDQLGVSHLYASPLFAAVPGSTHGYDGIDFSAMEPEIGGEDGFDGLCAALAEAGLGLLLDFVPNHMATADGNRWWQSVLEWGQASPYATYFDIDWSAPKLILPLLGVSYGEALEDGTFGLAFDAATGSFELTCYDRHLPLTPPSYEMLLSRTDDPVLGELAHRFAVVSVEQTDPLKRLLTERATEPGGAVAIENLVAAARSDTDLLHSLHAAQIWRLSHWRLARVALTYRRFFEIAELICLRVEDPAVFDAVHHRLFDLISSGRVAGVRLDHIDGLADPKSYIERFVRMAGAARLCYVLVEKILERDERLRPDWPVAGTTGYEFIGALAGLFVDRRREAEMTEAYHDFTGAPTDYATALGAAKREIFERNLAAELALLTARAQAIASADCRTRDLGADSLRRAIVEITAALPVYRSYVNAAGPSEVDRELISAAADAAKGSPEVENVAAVDFIAHLLLLDVGGSLDAHQALAFAIRFQQTTGPVMAKAAEDTLFYRYNRLIGLNDVGGDPERYGAPVEEFHEEMAKRRDSQLAGLSATSTHDTKRGEDGRARIYVLSEMPEVWRRAVGRWADMNRSHRRTLPGGVAPEPIVEWLFYQALLGAWPADLDPERQAQETDEAIERLRARMTIFMEKAVREAKLRTSWIKPDADYEEAVAHFVAAALSRATAGDFLADFAQRCRPIWLAGAIHSLAQVAIKLGAPGVPDIYQGSELWDFSLVDPDNRTPVDFAVRRRLLEEISSADPVSLLENWESGAPKMALTVAGLRARAERPELFASGSYLGLEVKGQRAEHVVAFTRWLDNDFAVVVASRLVLKLSEGARRPLVPVERWGDTAIGIPPALHGRPLRDVVTGKIYGGHSLMASEVLRQFPTAFLVNVG